MTLSLSNTDHALLKKQHFCPVSGLPAIVKKEWLNHKISSAYQASFHIVGNAILYIRPAGSVNLEDMKSALAFTKTIQAHIQKKTDQYVIIEDLSRLKKVTIDARNYLIKHLFQSKQVASVVFCNPSQLSKIFIKIGQRFDTKMKEVHIAERYPDAVIKAQSVCSDHGIDVGPYAFGKPTLYDNNARSLHPVDLITCDEWRIREESYTNDFALIDGSILHSVSKGFVKPDQIPLIDKFRESVRRAASKTSHLDYIVVDTHRLKGGSRITRQRYMASLKKYNQRHPFRMYIMYGVNAFMRAALLLFRPFMPFRIEIAKDLNHAFKLVQEDQQLNVSRISDSTPAEKAKNPLDADIQRLLAYMGGINWEKEGINIKSNTDPDDPFYVLFQAVKLIKNELDDLFEENRKNQETLKLSEEKYRELFEKGSDWICTHDLEGNLIESNFNLKSAFTDRKEKNIPHNLKDTIPEQYWPLVDDYLERIQRVGHDKGMMAVSIENGQKIVLEYNNVLIRDRKGNPTIVKGTAKDVTKELKAAREKKHLEEQLRQAQKMESIGTLAGGIAHDFNNILSIILGHSELALEDIHETSPVYDSILEIKSASLRAKDIVRQLLSFSRKTDQEFKPIQIVPVVSDALKFLRSTIPSTIGIHQDFAPSDETILGDATQISQVMMNLCNNASQAMEKTGGTLCVRTETVWVGQYRKGTYHDLNPGGYVNIQVSDTGSGIDPKHIDRIFDPYFTTKDVGKGSGMGLSVVMGIIKNHNAAVFVDSPPGKGTTFSIFFPLASPEPEPALETEKSAFEGNEKILFVDDEKSILVTAKKMLERSGYKVKTDENPAHALRQFRSNPDYFDLVITDMTMPHMNGIALMEKIRQIKKKIPVIICTGHSTLINDDIAKEHGVNALVIKPLVTRDLGATIRKVLDKTPRIATINPIS